VLEFRILGPLEVVEKDRPVLLGGPKQRALLAVLLLSRGEVVPTDRPVDRLWGERPPASAIKTVQVYVSNLRKALGDGLLITRGRGYALAVEPGQLDLDRFDALVASGSQALQAGDARAAGRRLRGALALWRGPPLADFAYETFAQSEIARLEETRLAALEERIEADLALGEDAALVGELEALVRQHPLRERLQGQLMLALYRSGRQAEALERYRQARRGLIDELGIEPGLALQELERAILSQDPALHPPSRRLPLDRLAPGPSRRGATLVAAGAALMLIVAITAALLTGGGGGSALTSLDADSLGLIDPATGALRAAVPIAGTPARLRIADRQLWVTSDDARTVSLIDSRTPAVARVAQVGAFPNDLAAGEGALWIVNGQSGGLVKINPDYGTVQSTTTLHSSATLSSLHSRNDVDPWSVATGAGAVWITDGTRLLRRADPVRGRVTTFDVHDRVNAVAVGGAAVWAVSGPSASVLQIDPRTGKVTARVAFVGRPGLESPYPIAVAAGPDSVWVLNANTADVTRIDPTEGRVTATIPIGIARGPRRLAVGAGAAWIANADGTLARIDGSTNAITTRPIAPSLYDVAVGAGGVWVTTGSAIGGATVAEGLPAGGEVHALPQSRCSPIVSQPGAHPRYVIASDFPLQGDHRDTGAQMTEAVEFELRARGFRAGDYAIGFQACDDSVASRPLYLTNRCASNMRSYVANSNVIGVIGPLNSFCAEKQIRIANRAPGGPLAIMSPSTTHVGLTRHGPGLEPGEPGVYYPTGQRNFVRIVAADDLQAAANVILARQQHLRRVFVVTVAGDPYATGIAESFALAAKRLGLPIVGTRRWDPTSPIAPLLHEAARTRPDGIFVAAQFSPVSTRPLLSGLHAAVPRAQLLGADGLALFPDLVNAAGPAVEGMTISQAGIAPPLLRGAGQQFVSRFGKQIGGAFYPYTPYAAQAADTMLDAISRSDGTRSSVARALLTTHAHNGIAGSFAIAPTGDTTAAAVTIFRVVHGQPVPVRVITPPASLASDA
jgi:DNA-binding SARP family transcriptional activator/ABC-type branched-subunit amino acid transport system substrate-binding protein/streptogramin lyase